MKWSEKSPKHKAFFSPRKYSNSTRVICNLGSFQRTRRWCAMRCSNSLPDKQTAGYMPLELIAISGELPTDQLRRLSGGDSYKLNVVRILKTKKLAANLLPRQSARISTDGKGKDGSVPRIIPNAFPFPDRFCRNQPCQERNHPPSSPPSCCGNNRNHDECRRTDSP